MHHKYTWRVGVLEVVMILVTLIYVVPLYLLVNVSLRASNDPAPALALPTRITFDNFAEAWERGNLGNALVNSGVVAIVSTVLIVLFAAFASYPLARSLRRWSKWTYYGFLAGLLLPFQLATIPLYLTMRDIGLLGSVWSLILFNVGTQMPFSIFLYAGFLRSVPIEYEEAASMDGAGPFATFWRVVFPLMRPITGTLAILNLINIWNDFFTPLLYLSGSGQQTVPVAIYAFFGQFTTEWNLVFAGLLISVAPVLLLYFVLQRTVITGFASGLKG